MRLQQHILCLLLFLGTVLTTQAQTPFKRELSIGASFGTTFSSVNFAPKVYQGMLMGYTGGATLRWITDKNVGLIAELNFVQQGWKEDFSDSTYPFSEGTDAGDYHYNRTLNYVELPFLTHIYFGSDKVRFIFNVGPKIGYLLSESTDENLNGITPNRYNAQYGLSVKNKFSWGLCGGPGIELRTGIGHFMLEGRFFYALGDLFGSTKADDFNKSSEQVISAKLTYFFPLGKK